MNNDFCKKCGQCCNNIKIDIAEHKMYRNGIESIDEEFLSILEPLNSDGQMTFYRCKFLKNNLCTNNNKPEICNNYPSFSLAYLPDNCGYEGIIFQKKEILKQKVRKLKEEIVHYNALIQTARSKSEIQQYQKLIASHTKYIKKYEQYGSDDW